MKRLLVIIFLLIFVGVGFAQAPPFPPNPTVGQEVTGADGQIYVWDGVKWARKIPGAYAPETKTSLTPPANPTAGQLWFDPLNLQTYIWYTDPTSSQWVAIVNGATGGGGGGGPFLPEDNPTFTGLMTGPAIHVVNNQDSLTTISLSNNSTGANAALEIDWNNGTFGGAAGLTGGGFTSPMIPANATFLYNGASGGISIANNSTAPTNIWSNSILTASFIGQALVFPNTNYSQLQFGTYEAPTASILGYSNTGTFHIASGAWWRGDTWVRGVNVAPVELAMYMDTTNAYSPTLDIQTGGNGLAGTGITWRGIGRFEDNPYIHGLDLPGFANRFGLGQAFAGLTVGNSYFSGVSWANVYISGAVYPISSGAGWQTDCGAGGGVAMIGVGPGYAINMFKKGPMGCNTGFQWDHIAGWSPSGMHINHIENDDEFEAPTSARTLTTTPVPSVTSGALVKGSRDMSGWIKDVKGGQTTLTFVQPFDGESTCTLTDAGQPNLWFEANQTTGQVTFACVVPSTGEPCPDGAIVEYHCFGQGG